MSRWGGLSHRPQSCYMFLMKVGNLPLNNYVLFDFKLHLKVSHSQWWVGFSSVHIEDGKSAVLFLHQQSLWKLKTEQRKREWKTISYHFEQYFLPCHSSFLKHFSLLCCLHTAQPTRMSTRHVPIMLCGSQLDSCTQVLIFVLDPYPPPFLLLSQQPFIYLAKPPPLGVRKQLYERTLWIQCQRAAQDK